MAEHQYNAPDKAQKSIGLTSAQNILLSTYKCSVKPKPNRLMNALLAGIPQSMVSVRLYAFGVN